MEQTIAGADLGQHSRRNNPMQPRTEFGQQCSTAAQRPGVAPYGCTHGRAVYSLEHEQRAGAISSTWGQGKL